MIFPSIASLIITLPQVLKKRYNLLDLTTLAYFTLVAVASFLQGGRFFAERGAFISYALLFSVSLTSLLIKKPFTLEIAKRAYPESYWKDEIFIMVNVVITTVWTGVFLINALLFLILSGIYPIILSNLLVAAGIIFSMIFPKKGPTYFISRKFKRKEWKVRVKPRSQKLQNEYDVIIVGSGIGGLSCGALLSLRGYKVLVLEQHYQAGGYCSSFSRKGFTFNCGVENVSGLWEGGTLSLFLKKLGLNKEDFFVKNTVRYLFRGEAFDVVEPSDFMDNLLGFFPEERDGIKRFFSMIERALEESQKEKEPFGAPLPPEIVVEVLGANRLLSYPRDYPTLYELGRRTLRDLLDEYFKSDDIKRFLCALIGYLGTVPEKTSGRSALGAMFSYYAKGGYFPKGGAQKFADALKGVIEANGGEVLLRHRVERILVRTGKTYGVKVGSKFFKSSVVVANANAKIVFLNLIDSKELEKSFLEYIRELKMSPSVFMVFLGVDADLSSYPTLIENLDNGYGVVINSNADPSLAPHGKSSVTIITGANYYDFPERGTEEYNKRKGELSDLLIEKTSEVIPELEGNILVKDAATPRTFEAYTSMPEGAIYSFDQSIDVKRPYFKSPIEGLYLASASTFPGGGIEAVIISGIICANDICGWERR
ncbi:MAG: NAD(P)/FAD-dependent oxidoreductase [Synergistetes bacterium]|nr:NAD(P)/FAD-dependent oxidoreductase [Synergistota bacterium]